MSDQIVLLVPQLVGDAVHCELYGRGHSVGKDQKWRQSAVERQSCQPRRHDQWTQQLNTLLHHSALDFTTVYSHKYNNCTHYVQAKGLMYSNEVLEPKRSS